MKLLIYSLYQPDFVDGASVSARALTQRFRDAGIDVSIWTTDIGWRKDQIPLDPCPHLRVYHACFSHSLEIAPKLFWHFCRQLRCYDLVHFRGIFSLGTCLGAFAARSLGCPYVISPLGNWPPLWKDRATVRRGTAKVLFFRLLCKQALEGASRVVCASEAERDCVQQVLPPARAISIPNGIDIADHASVLSRHDLFHRLGVPPDTHLFLFLGRLAPEKGLQFLLKAWEKTAMRLPDARLIIAGDASLNGAFERPLRLAVAKLTRPDTVTLPGAITGALKHSLLRHSCCLLLPSHRESFGNVVLEALSVGTPVLASVGTPWSSLESTGLGKWLPWDEDLWSDSMLAMAEIPSAARVQISSRSRQWVAANYSWDATAREYIRTYEEVLRANPVRRCC